MTDREKNKAFKAERKRQLKRLLKANRGTAKEVEALLKEADVLIRGQLGNPTDYQAWSLPIINKNINQAMKEIGEALAEKAGQGATAAWGIGVDLVDLPLAAGGIQLAGVLQDVDLRQLMAMRTFMIDRMKDVSLEVASKAKSQIGLTMMGAQTPGDAVGSIARIVKGGRSRALTVVRTEMGTAFSVATQERQQMASEFVPGLSKQWRRSGKVHSRIGHDLADGQIVAVDKPFVVNGVKLMFPRDPAGPIKERVNCGCVSLPHMESWEVRQPGRMPFTDQEIHNNPQKRDLARELNP